MSNFIAYCKIGCPHSEETINLLSEFEQKGDLINIITLDTDNINILKINNVDYNNSKENFFNQYIKKIESIDIGTHRSFPIVLYKSSDNIKYYIGGNDELQKIYRKALTTEIPKKFERESICIKNFIDFETDGKRRLYCHLLKLFNQ
jgi:thiol-disulfide isomerase/thioredoxin